MAKRFSLLSRHIISGYLVRELAATLSVVTGVLVLIFLADQFVRYIAKAAAGKIATTMVLKILGLQIPYLLGLLLPLGFYIGILLAYGRMYVESEMTVLTACGYSRGRLIKTTLLFSIVIIVISASLNFYFTPRLEAYKDSFKSASQADQLVQTVMPGRFESVAGGKLVLYIEDVNRDRTQVKNIFVAMREKKTPGGKKSFNQDLWSVAVAKTAHEATDPDSGNTFIVANDGYRYYGVPGQKSFQIIKYGEYGMRLDSQRATAKQDHGSMSLKQLWKTRKTDSHSVAELQWRLATPISVPILALLGIALCRVRPRQGRFAQLLPAIILYTIYANMMFVARDWIEDGITPAYLGLWWLHGLLLTTALILLIDGHTWRRVIRWLHKALGKK